MKLISVKTYSKSFEEKEMIDDLFELPSLIALQKITDDFFLGKKDLDFYLEKCRVPWAGYLNTYFGVNYFKGGIGQLLEKPLDVFDRTNSDPEEPMLMKIDWGLSSYTDTFNVFIYFCDHCNRIFKIPSIVFAKGNFNYALFKKGSENEIPYDLFLNFFPNFELNNQICEDQLSWLFFSGEMYWTDEVFKDKDNRVRNRNDFMIDKIW